MQGDFSRWTYSPKRSYRSVLLQQGRVLLDADWNEQTEITAHHDEVRARDIVGPRGGPAPTVPGETGGFAIVDAAGNRPAGVAWSELFTTPGRYYVDGVLCESFPREDAASTAWPLTDQPFLAVAEPDASEGDGRYAVYLDVWTHHVTADEAPELLEPALGGPDTTTRSRTVWQVRVIRLAGDEDCSDLNRDDWLQRTPPSMIAELRPPDAESDPCQITASGGYQRLENQLYRVQIHAPADAGQEGGEDDLPATYLWSRENASVVAGLDNIEVDDSTEPKYVLILDRVGRDDELSFRQGDVVEVTSTTRELSGLPGFLGTAGAPDGLELPVEWIGAPADLDQLGDAPIVRRWEGGPTPVAATPAELEGGIEVRFPVGGTAATGDYWLIPARTVRLSYGMSAISGTIDWPRDEEDHGLPQLPLGPVHRFAPLAILARTGTTWTAESDCRRLFPALTDYTDLVSIDVVGGDGQEAMPGEWLPLRIRVAVRAGGRPIVGARVLFRPWVGGYVSTASDPYVPEGQVIAVSEDDGIAKVHWLLAPAGPPGQLLDAQLLDDYDNPVGVGVRVSAGLSIASQVAWTPACDGFAAQTTVQGALDQLVATTELRLLGGDGQTTRSGNTVPQPIRVVLDSPCGPVAAARVVARATDGAFVMKAEDRETPSKLEGLEGAAGEVAIETGLDGVAAFWWQPYLSRKTSDALEIAVVDAQDAPIRIGAQLAGDGAGQTPGVHITGLRFLSGIEFENDMTITVDDLLSGIRVDLDGTVVHDTFRGKPVVRIVMQTPEDFGEEHHEHEWGHWTWRNPVAWRDWEVAGSWNSDDFMFIWSPQEDADPWLRRELSRSTEWGDTDQVVLGRFIIDGWAIQSADDQNLHLNCHAKTRLVDGRTVFELPTDDEVTGGQFNQWFRIVVYERPGGRGQSIEVPDLIRMTRARAERVLAETGLAWVGADEPSNEIRRNSVVRTEPGAGSKVEAGSAVRVFVSTGHGG